MKFKNQQPLSAVLKTTRSIVVTPISYKEDSDSYIDFHREMKSYVDGYSVMWDDASSNDSHIGDLFAFITGQGRKETDLEALRIKDGYCQIRRVISVFPYDHRPKGLWKIPEHIGRNVLVLGDIEYEGTWVDLCEACDHEAWGKELSDGTRVTSPRQGTLRWKIN